MLAEVLTLDGYPVQEAVDAEQGLKVLQQTTEGWVVLMQLDPWEDMWELMQMLHKDPKLRAHHRIIQADIQYYVDLGRSLEPDDVLVLPPRLEQLLKVVERNWDILQDSETS
jgi:hypothetical protein